MPGLIHIYCGDGKGKTTALLGLALRAAGSGKKVLLLQFFKDGKSAEFASLAHVPGIEVVPQTRTFGFSWTLSEEEKREAAAYYSGLLEDAFRRSGDFDLLALDEGVCVQVLHLGSYDSEPESVARMDAYIAENGYENDMGGDRRHHEIYLSDPRKTSPEKWKTVIRHPIRRK